MEQLLLNQLSSLMFPGSQSQGVRFYSFVAFLVLADVCLRWTAVGRRTSPGSGEHPRPTRPRPYRLDKALGTRRAKHVL